MTIHFHLAPLLAFAAGIAILLVPPMHRLIVAAYLIAIGIIGLVR